MEPQADIYSGQYAYPYSLNVDTFYSTSDFNKRNEVLTGKFL